jgi:hypothetical protein
MEKWDGRDHPFFPVPLTFLPTICISAISDPMDSDRLWGLIEQYAVVAHS